MYGWMIKFCNFFGWILLTTWHSIWILNFKKIRSLKGQCFQRKWPMPKNKNKTRGEILCAGPVFFLYGRVLGFVRHPKKHKCRGEIFPFLPRPLRPSFPRDAHNETEPCSTRQVVSVNTLQTSIRWRLPGHTSNNSNTFWPSFGNVCISNVTPSVTIKNYHDDWLIL